MTDVADADRGVRLITTAVRQFGRPGPASTWSYSTADVLACDDHGLLGAVAHECDAGRLQMPDDARAVTVTLCGRATSEAVVLESRAAAAVSTLAGQGIATRVLKGVAVANLDYPDPTLRQFGDVDLLVHGQDMSAAVATFAALGYTRHFAEPFTGFDEHIGKGIALENAERTVFDLHRTLALGYYGTRLDVDDLWENPTSFEVAGETVLALPPAHRFVHAALHLALSPVHKVSNGLDLCIIASANDIDASEIIDLAVRWGCARPTALAVRTTTHWFGHEWAPPGLIDWCTGRRTSLADRLVMSTYDGVLGNSRARSASAILGLRTGAQRWRALRGLVTRGHHERE